MALLFGSPCSGLRPRLHSKAKGAYAVDRPGSNAVLEPIHDSGLVPSRSFQDCSRPG
jgi:hypothetical protein